jgi:hypothetical protein
MVREVNEAAVQSLWNAHPAETYAPVYSLRQAAMDFPDFRIIEAYKRYMHAPAAAGARTSRGGACRSALMGHA